MRPTRRHLLSDGLMLRSHEKTGIDGGADPSLDRRLECPACRLAEEEQWAYSRLVRRDLARNRSGVADRAQGVARKIVVGSIVG